MESIYKYSEYGCLEIENPYNISKEEIELSVQCLKDVYAAAFAMDENRLHIIFNPYKTNVYKIYNDIYLFIKIYCNCKIEQRR